MIKFLKDCSLLFNLPLFPNSHRIVNTCMHNYVCLLCVCDFTNATYMYPQGDREQRNGLWGTYE